MFKDDQGIRLGIFIIILLFHSVFLFQGGLLIIFLVVGVFGNILMIIAFLLRRYRHFLSIYVITGNRI